MGRISEVLAHHLGEDPGRRPDTHPGMDVFDLGKRVGINHP